MVQGIWERERKLDSCILEKCKCGIKMRRREIYRRREKNKLMLTLKTD
jgi:hypothetical protein